jgi:hypothetical protein
VCCKAPLQKLGSIVTYRLAHGIVGGEFNFFALSNNRIDVISAYFVADFSGNCLRHRLKFLSVVQLSIHKCGSLETGLDQISPFH